MIVQQASAFAIIIVTVGIFAWGRFRYDLVALGALLVGLALGVVRPADAFTGFTSDVVVVIAAALVISAAVAKSGVVETALRPLLDRLKTPATQAPILAGATALLSIPTKNVGALAILMPTALQMARRTGTSPSSLLMPMSFMSLLGGLVTLVGTSTNIIVSQVRREAVGKPFAMFDFAPVGLVLMTLGLIFVSFAWRLLPTNRQGRSGLEEAAADAVYSTEATVPDDWPEDLARVADLKLDDNHVTLTSLVSPQDRKSRPLPDAPVRPGDLLLLEGEESDIDNLFARLPLAPAHQDRPAAKTEAREEVRAIDAVIQLGSPLAGATAGRLLMHQTYGVKLLAIRRSGERISERLRDVVLRGGDVLVLQAGESVLPSALREMGVLPLVERESRLGSSRPRFGPAIILGVAMALVALKLVPVAPAFFGAAVLMVVSRALSMREAYGSLDAQVLVLIGALTPLSEAVKRTGGVDLVAGQLAGALHGAPPLVMLGALMVAAMACSPFLHNAPTVLVLGPIGAALAQRLHLNPDPFLMAVATGAGCDFLTPVGHQCNTLVMGPGGYRFSDYWRLGLPLSVLVIVVGAPMIAWVWPLAGGR
jgi:di/tricarboxylate transporter